VNHKLKWWQSEPDDTPLTVVAAFAISGGFGLFFGWLLFWFF
jgi:hypothetical protein